MPPINLGNATFHRALNEDFHMGQAAQPPLEPNSNAAPPSDSETWSQEIARKTRRSCFACHSRLGSPLQREDLEDVVQEALIAVWRKRHMCLDLKRFDSWIYGVARLSILKRLQAHNRSRLVSNADLGELAKASQPPETLSDSMTHLGSHVGRHLDIAGETVAAILKGRFEEDRGFETIAGRLGLSLGAVRSRYYRVLPQLKIRLHPLWRPFGVPK